MSLLKRLFGALSSTKNTVEVSPPLPKIDFAVCGIGNIGEEYEGTRHNIGFDMVRGLSAYFKGSPWCSLSYSYESVIKVGGKSVVLFMPTTFVNLSGNAASEIQKRYGLTEKELLVITDDFHLELGTVRFREGGSAGGHNGLKSIIGSVGEGFYRLRVGVGPLVSGVSIIDFVLGRFLSEQEPVKKTVVDHAGEFFESFISEGFESARNRFNGRDFRPSC